MVYLITLPSLKHITGDPWMYEHEQAYHASEMNKTLLKYAVGKWKYENDFWFIVVHEETDLATLKLVHGDVIRAVLKKDTEDDAVATMMMTDMLDY